MKKFIGLLILLGIAGWLLAGCSTPPTSVGGSGGGGAVSIDGDWVLEAINIGSGEQAALAGVPTRFSFTNGALGASAGCNQLGGDYTLDGNTLSFGPIIQTEMACEPAIMAQEQAVTTILQSATSATLNNGTLVISTADGQTLTLVQS